MSATEPQAGSGPKEPSGPGGPGGPGRALAGLIGREIVIDTDSSYVYLGVVEAVDEQTVTLAAADVHDVHDTPATKEIYVHTSRRHGVRSNRERVVIFLSRIVSFSLLDEVTRY